jgi:hypothetical protein
MNCWSVCEDIDALYKQFGLREMSQDEIQNCLLGLKTLYQMKFEQLFAMFEGMIKERELK